MRKVISVRDLQDLLRQGADLASALPGDAILTPSARDLLRERGVALSAPTPARNGAVGQARPSAPAPAAAPASGPRPLPKVRAAEIARFFESPEIQAHKLEICDIGRRLWQRAYVDGNGGNISIRVAEDLVLCSPTLVSKGFMKPEDLCLVDMEGQQKAGAKKRTSELLMHLAIYKKQPRAKACVHAHPPHATGFAVAGVSPPNCMIPEMEIMCGQIPIAPYLTPGTLEMGEAVGKLADVHNTILMANHGVVAWGFGVEDAYFKMEILEAYCRTVLVTTQLGKGPNTISPQNVARLLEIKQTLGIPDPRMGLKECELCDNSDWRPGVTCSVTRPADGPPADAEAEELVQRVTDEILKALER